MTGPLSPAAQLLIEFLGELGPRWGLPDEPCRLHGYLYLRARPVTEDEMGAALGLDSAEVRSALTWLHDYRLVARSSETTWRTESDPWELMMRALEERRRREADPALKTLRACQDEAAKERSNDPILYVQIGKLLALAEDLTALDNQARRLSPRALRRMVGIGGSASRFFDRAFGKGKK